MCVFLCMGGNSTTWMNTAVLVTCIRNFKRNRGPVVGILKGYIGLSTAIFTDLCSALFSSSASSFLMMLTLIPGAVCVSSMIFLRPLPSATNEAEEKRESSKFGLFNAIAVIVAVYLLAFDITGEHGVVLSRSFAAFLLILLAAPLVVPLKVLLEGSSCSSDVESQIRQPLIQDQDKQDESVTKGKDDKREELALKGESGEGRPRLGEDHTIMQALRNVDFWLLFFAFLCGVGTGMAVINNMGQIGQAMGYSDVSVFVSLISIWGFFGRIGAGSISEHFLKKAGVPRPVWMAASQVLMVVGYAVMSVGMGVWSLYMGSIVVGICYGVRLSVSVPTASELFGLKYYGIIYNFLILNLPIGSLLFSGLLAGFLYDIEAAKDDGGEDNKCVGAHCYRMVFIVMAVVCILGLALDLLLSLRTRALYRNIFESRKSEESSSTPSTKAPSDK
eukprot:TRINITY_DN2923_c0_g1_i2.p1 TRINITY_DN2923_c0_g1~~TRINITY_DN2923_c0_g1_i2.p1  ORF type:complete len:446 (-),score=-15.52 TRINITY_DN2923_c0_g1_i2:416-1753(-)